MPRKPKFPPYPRNAHSSGQARVKIRGKPFYLGPHGSEESWRKYHELQSRWSARLAAGETLTPDPSPPPAGKGAATIRELVARFHLWARAEGYRWEKCVERLVHALKTCG